MRVLLATSCALAAATSLAAAPQDPDPWVKVPAVPTTCYSGQDRFSDEIGAAIDAMNQAIYRQQEINTRLNEQLNAVDPMEQASRMQSYMMEHPEEAADLLQMVQGAPAAGEADMNKETGNEQRLQDELEELKSRYDAALEKVMGPLEARLDALGLSETGSPAEAMAQGNAIRMQMNAAYEKACPPWWGASSPFTAWLKTYKDHLVTHRIPYRERGEMMKVTQFRILGIPADTFKPTVAMETVVLYMQKAQDIFQYRWVAPIQDLMKR